MKEHYDFLTTLYFLKTGQFFPELLLNDESDSDKLIPLLEDALKNNRIVTYEDIMKTLNINENEYDISIPNKYSSK